MTMRLLLVLGAAGLIGSATAIGSHREAQPAAASGDLGGLPRRNSRPVERHSSIDTLYGSFKTRAGYRVRTIETVPSGATGRLPAVLFVQWLSCDSVEIDPKDSSGWSGMIRALVQTPGFIVMRTEKPGIGDSDGPRCETLDYDSELEVHREALERLFQDPRVDPKRIVIVGMSMGSNMAPILAAERPVAAIAVWGGGAWRWRQRQLRFEERAMRLSGIPAAEVERQLRRVAKFYDLYLGRDQSPAQIEAANPDLRGLWGKVLVGTGDGTHFGRPLAFHRQAQAHDWLGAWKRIRVPALVMLGRRDWYEDPRSAQMAVDAVNASHPGLARLALFPGLDHHFVRYPSDEAAFKGEQGEADPSGPIRTLRAFLTGVGPTRGGLGQSRR